MLSGILIATLVVGGTGLFIGVFLGIAGKKFAVVVDEREEAILDVLPGNNCGGCGYAGCSGLASAIVKGDAPVNACPVGGARVAKQVADIMGEDAGESKHMVAFVHCAGSKDVTNREYEYYGLHDCMIVNMMQNSGPKTCNYGCLGDGNCVSACPFDAIHVENGVAIVDKDACKACSKCVAACPRHLISLVPYDHKHLIRCNNEEKGKEVQAACKVGCIGCKMCQRQCKFDAISMQGNLAVMDLEKCTDCGACALKCPRKVILQG
ncbi:MAG: RnfABCDGE type electron transport complex subunit B [Lachnospiraceae bacterium]|jgi:Na+-translocating ferredoxin:NAD+ oxidoreductase RNF subunit RnfB|nr:RnfABCDGE type electron transport complex subunit B [Lachnospiraceae bacterium]